MTLQRLLPTLAAFAACTMLLALLWRFRDPWHGPGQIAIVPLAVGGIGSLIELGRDARMRRLVFVLAAAGSWPCLTAMMALTPERWTALVIGVLGAVATVLGAWLRPRGGERA